MIINMTLEAADVININNPSPIQFTTSIDQSAARLPNGTVYHNISSNPMLVSFSLQFANPIGIHTPSFAIGPTNNPQIINLGNTIPIGTGNFVSAMSFIVPPGWYYKVTSSGATPLYWIETQ